MEQNPHSWNRIWWNRIHHHKTKYNVQFYAFYALEPIPTLLELNTSSSMGGTESSNVGIESIQPLFFIFFTLNSISSSPSSSSTSLIFIFNLHSSLSLTWRTKNGTHNNNTDLCFAASCIEHFTRNTLAQHNNNFSCCF